MFEGVNLLDFGLYGGAFFLLFLIFIKFIYRIIEDNRTDARLQRETFASALHDITNEVKYMGKELAIVSTKFDEHIKTQHSDS